MLCTFNFPWYLEEHANAWQDRDSASDPRYWFYSLSLLSLECFCWEAPMCVARAECPRSRNLVKPLASGKCLFGGNSVGYFFFTCYNEWVNGIEQSRSKAEPRGDLTADGEPGVQHLCLDGATCSTSWQCGAARLPWHLLSMAVPFGCKSCGLLLYFFVCVGTVLLKMVGVVWKLLILYRTTE